MIKNIFEFDDTTAGQISTHKREAVCLYMEDSAEEWAEIIQKSRHTYYPICGEDQDDIIGILNPKIYFRSEQKDPGFYHETGGGKALLCPGGDERPTLFSIR